MNISIILSGGKDGRFASDRPKQYQRLMGREVISYSVQEMKKSEFSDMILIASDKESVERLTTVFNAICIEWAVKAAMNA